MAVRTGIFGCTRLSVRSGVAGCWRPAVVTRLAAGRHKLAAIPVVSRAASRSRETRIRTGRLPTRYGNFWCWGRHVSGVAGHWRVSGFWDVVADIPVVSQALSSSSKARVGARMRYYWRPLVSGISGWWGPVSGVLGCWFGAVPVVSRSVPQAAACLCRIQPVSSLMWWFGGARTSRRRRLASSFPAARCRRCRCCCRCWSLVTSSCNARWLLAGAAFAVIAATALRRRSNTRRSFLLVAVFLQN